MAGKSWTYSREFSAYPLMAATGKVVEGSGLTLIYNPDSRTCYTVVDNRARHVTYIWDTNRPSWVELDNIAAAFGFPDDCPSWSRLCKYIYRTQVTSELSGLKPHRDFVLMAEKKFFWHFHKCVPGYHSNATELDIKGAYANSITRHDSLYLKAPFNPVDDGGAMDRLKKLIPILPKKLRLCLIGFLASNKMFQYYVDPAQPELLATRVVPICYDGGVFNRIHASLAGLYHFLIEMDAIAGDDCVRIHTDSLLIKESIPDIRLEKLFSKCKNEGYELAVKGHGNSVLFNINEAVIGGRIVGNPKIILKRWDAYIRGIEREATRVAELDKRMGHLAYKNERYSIAQARELISLKPRDIIGVNYLT